MPLLLSAFFAGALQVAPFADRSTEPVFRGEGDGRLVLVDVPETVTLGFYVVQWRREPRSKAAPRFEVIRSGAPTGTGNLAIGELFVDEATGVSFRIEAGSLPFAPGDSFSFITFAPDTDFDELLDRWVNQYVRWIISKEERARFEAMATPAEKLTFIESFWKRRDADPRTPQNEYREEHARRFAYAVETFGAGTPGWATDRGKVYILLGPPHAIERNPAGRTAFERASEIWTYNSLPNPRLPASLDIAFVDFTGTGRHEIVSASNLDLVAPLRTNIGYAMSELEAIGLLRSGGAIMDQATGFRTEVRETDLSTAQFDFQQELTEVAKVPQLTMPNLREVTQASASFPSLPVSTEASFFPADESTAFVPITLSIPYARLTPEPAEEGYRYQVDVLVQVTDDLGESAITDSPLGDRVEVRVASEDLASYRESELLYEASVVLPPGRYRIQATLRDNPSGALGQSGSEIEVPRPMPAELTLSSLLLVSGAVETAPIETADGASSATRARAPFQFGNLRLLPNVEKTFAAGSRLTAYFQAYGFEPGSSAPELRVDFFILRDGRLVSKVAPSKHRPDGERIAIKSDISLSRLSVGDYILRARVTNELTGQKAERDAPFKVRPRRQSDP